MRRDLTEKTYTDSNIMANKRQLKILQQGVAAWNEWRKKNPEKEIDLSRSDLHEADLCRANLANANLTDVNFERAKLKKANLMNADLSGSNLMDSDLSEANLYSALLINADLNNAFLQSANLCFACLDEALLVRTDLFRANLSNASLVRAVLEGAYLFDSNLCRADLSEADLYQANLCKTDLSDADLSDSSLTMAILVETILDRATLTNCNVYGISAWGIKLNGTNQKNLRITPIAGAPAITVDNLEVAQFIYLLLNNEKIRKVIETITSKVVLILGRFSPERKIILDAIREELRKHDYVPVLFDFDKPDSRDSTETVTTLARMSRFIIADITDPKSIPLELQAIVHDLAVPVQPLLEEGSAEFSMFKDLRRKYRLFAISGG